MDVAVIVLCMSVIIIVALQAAILCKRKELQRGRNTVRTDSQKERLRYLPFEQALLGRNAEMRLSPTIAQKAQEVEEHFKVVDDRLSLMERKIDPGGLSDAQSTLLKITYLLDEMTLEGSDETPDH